MGDDYVDKIEVGKLYSFSTAAHNSIFVYTPTKDLGKVVEIDIIFQTLDLDMHIIDRSSRIAHLSIPAHKDKKRILEYLFR